MNTMTDNKLSRITVRWTGQGWGGGGRGVETQIKNVIPAFCSSYFVSFIKSFIFHEGILYLYVSN